ncbi:5' nucleotidase, NT5C type [Bernardetia sp.]|uniref:5' nucleotidase, NT5C type n=1 Tax=Bernardetia sp. TaxID=1937974 RepID=UPI0025BCB42E|nr:hypothetical protein [Bernardetia sp.]
MKKIIYVDMDDVLCDYKAAFTKAIEKNPEIQYPQSQFDFFRKLKPITGSIEAIEFLRKQDIFEVYILTAPSLFNPISYLEKRLWIEDHLGFEFVEKLIISPNKGLLKGDYLIDDITEGKGQEGFEGTLLHFGKEKYPNWKSIIHYFTTTYSI